MEVMLKSRKQVATFTADSPYFLHKNCDLFQSAAGGISRSLRAVPEMWTSGYELYSRATVNEPH